ncbi:aromatic prenyltransferase [Aspergillus ambiguus]|uniref:aromatic prenyltransferase n=1 Tax=Aspergillus ambiguus TaxID=176160 RepID=UPI003CCD2A23
MTVEAHSAAPQESPASRENHPSAPDFWAQHMRSVIGPLMQAIDTYSPADQEANLRFLDEHIAPTLGPLPTDPHPTYVAPCAVVGTPFNPSFNVSSTGTPKVRFDYDLLPPLDRARSADPWGEAAARALLLRLAAVVGADTQWLEHFLSRLFLTPAETEALRPKIPPQLVLPAAMVGFEFNAGRRPRMKAWVPSMRRAIVEGRSSNEIALEALRGLTPLGADIAPAVDVLAGWIAESPHDLRLILAGMDCSAPRDSRIKMYLVTVKNSWETVRDVMTLGGRLADAASRKRVALLRAIWPYLMNESEGDRLADATWCKPERMPGVGFYGLMYSVEIKPGRPLPETKLYVPLFQYAESSAVAEKNMETVLTLLDTDWGRSGRYRRAMEATFGKGKEYGQVFAAYAYSESTGGYINSYVSRPIENSPVHPIEVEYV